MIAAHLPALQIVLPLVAAPLCLLLRPQRLLWPFVVAVGWGTLALAALLLQQVLSYGPISYALGGWSPPWGIEFRVDVLNAYLILLVALIGAVVLTYAPASAAREVEAERRPYFCAIFLLCLAGLLGIAITGDAFNVFVFMEISSLSAYGLISLGRDRRALMATYNYLILGTIGATFILIGIGLMYAMTGTLNMADLAGRIEAVSQTRTIHVAFAFISVGFTLKMALFPLHIWLPNAYTYAPSAVTAFIAATATKVAVYAFLRFVFTIFGADFAFGTMHLDVLLLPLVLLGIFIASAVAIYQTDLKRLLAYSSVAQIGYVMLGVSLGSATGLTAGIVHLFNHALMKAALFPSRWLHLPPHQFPAIGRPQRVGQASAADFVRLCPRRLGASRRAVYRGLYQQVVLDLGCDRARLVASGCAGGDQFAAGAGLYLALCRDRLFPPGSRRC